MDKKQYNPPTIKVVAVKTEHGFAGSQSLGMSHEGFLDELCGNELYIDNTTDPGESDWVEI